MSKWETEFPSDNSSVNNSFKQSQISSFSVIFYSFHKLSNNKVMMHGAVSICMPIRMHISINLSLNIWVLGKIKIF
ncbi:hypothetical protein ACIN8IBEIGE_20117 [Acinetobacter sp. 8I-beige]|nr:hypothetical protein ACIN8IBEIGE_20117 [Acinetobacter sp. 8I-beige]